MKLWHKGGFRLDNELDRHWLSWAIIAWGCVVAWFIFQRFGNIQWLLLGDTDDNMRLAQVRALLAGQGWYDLTQYKLDPALGGLNIHWSRFVDLPIAGLILLLQPFIGTAAAEKWACGLAPMLPLAITMGAIGLTVRRLISVYSWPLGLIILMGCTSTMTMYMPMRTDHHGWQLACLALTVAGLADPRRARGGVTVGLSSALSLTIGLEMLPYCAMAGAIIALRWVWDAGEARRMQLYGLTLAGGSSIGFAAFASTANQAMRCDALTPVWLSVVLAGGALLFVLSLVNPQQRWVRLAMGAAAGAAIAGGFAALFPQCLARPEGVSDELYNTWLANVREARPIYRVALDQAFPISVLPAIGVIGASVATWRAWRQGSESVVGWAAVALFTAFAGVMLVWQVRAGPAAQMLSVPGATALAWIVVPWILALRPPVLRNRWLNMLASLSFTLLRVGGSVVGFLLVSGLFAGFTGPLLKEKDGGKSTPDLVGQANAACARMSSLSPLNRIPKSVLFTHVDLGPRLITMTHHSGIAGPYHRNGRQILDVHHAFTWDAKYFRGIARTHEAKYLLVCPNMAETTVYRSRNPNGFYGQLHKGRVPKWLEPVTLPKGSPLRLWKINYDLPEDPVSAPRPRPQRPGSP